MSSEFDATASIVMSGVSKKYRLFDSPTDRLLEAVWPYRKRHSDFWALRDIDLCISKGETVGIVGRNGSGKSTLLQMIAGIFAPTSGTLTVNGRVSALLELGAGFNPEFSGRDNAVMNGVFRGLSAREMNEKLPEIEAFADIGKFFDRPVKTYSSGMFVRVAFAASISIEPDILLVDEALAVGDVKFQHKCYGAIREMQKNGVTIVLVTHDLQAVAKHCQRAAIIDGGSLLAYGDVKDVTDRFYAMMMTGEDPISQDKFSTGVHGGDGVCGDGDDVDCIVSTFLNQPFSDQDKCAVHSTYNADEIRFGDGRAKIVDYLFVCDGVADPQIVRSGSVIDFYVHTVYFSSVKAPCYGFAIKTKDGVLVHGSNLVLENVEINSFHSGETSVYKFSIKMDLNAGDYFISQGVAEFEGVAPIFLDSRQGFVHLVIDSLRKFDGVAALDSSFSEISRSKMTKVEECCEFHA